MSQKTLKPHTINYKTIPCPQCHTKGNYNTDKRQNKYCTECGTIIDTPYPYIAGIRHNNISDFINNNKGGKKRCKKKQT